MMQRLWEDILKRFGQRVTLCAGEREAPVQALIQPCLEEQREQETAGPLGLERQERLRYMGPADCPLDPDTLVVWKGREYRVQSAHLVGERICSHWWAILRPRDEAAV